MSRNISNKETRTKAYVLRRTNYGEADRIVNFITPNGKISAIAKSVRKEKSKIAGGIEMFCLVDIMVRRDHGELGIITSSRMVKYYENIVSDLKSLELASVVLKKINAVSESSDSPEFFNILDQTLSVLNNGANHALVEGWFWLNIAKATGEEVNLYRDVDGQKLQAEKSYVWDVSENALREKTGGSICANEIKLMRLMLTNNLATVVNINGVLGGLSDVLHIAKSVNKL